MTEREKNFCSDLAEYLCYPDSMEIGSVAKQLRDIIVNLTKGKKNIRKCVLEFCERNVVYELYDSDTYRGTKEEVMDAITSDYDQIFFY